MFDIPNLLTRGLYVSETPYISRFDFTEPPLYEGKIFRQRTSGWEVHMPVPSYVLSEFFLSVNADFGPSMLFAGLEKRIRRFQSEMKPSEIMLYYRGRTIANAVTTVERPIFDNRLNRQIPGKFLCGGFCIAGLVNERIVGFTDKAYPLLPHETAR